MIVRVHRVRGGRIVEDPRGAIAPEELGFLCGDGVFETIRVQHGAALLLEAHLARLRHGLVTLGIAAPDDIDAFRDPIATVVAASPDAGASGRLRLTVGRGASAAHDEATAVVALAPWRPAAAVAHGVAIEVSRHRREPHPRYTIKSTSRAEYEWLRREAVYAETFDVLQYNTRGHLAEGSFTNVFLVDAKGTLRTPHPRDGCLPGVTRAAVLDLARGAGIACREGAVAAPALDEAAEIFLTSSLHGIVPVRSVGGTVRPALGPGAVTHALGALWTAAHTRPRSTHVV